MKRKKIVLLRCLVSGFDGLFVLSTIVYLARAFWERDVDVMICFLKVIIT